MTNEEIARESLLWYQRAIKAIEKGNHNLAYDFLLIALELNPLEPIFRFQFSVTANRLARPADFLREIAFNNATAVCRMMPAVSTHWVMLGEVCINSLKYPEAIAAFERALEFMPDNADLWALLGFANVRSGNYEGALVCYKNAVKIEPELGMAHFYLSMAYTSAEQFDPAKAAYHGERAFMAKRPAQTHLLESYWNAAHGHLHTGEYGKGWSYFEVRLQRMMINAGSILITQRFKKAMWRGERNCRLLVIPEMGMGDSFIMARFLPMVRDRFDFKVIMECPQHTIGLFRASFPDMEFVLPSDLTEDMFDHYIPMLSLPHVLRIKSEKIPWNGGYLEASAEKKREWGDRLNLSSGLNIGICWAGGSRGYNAESYQIDKRRSLKFEQIQPLLAIPGINWISLMTENEPDEFKNPGIKNFEDTAAIIHHLDGVVSVDTAVINLVGAMNKKGWCLSRHDNCWRWSPMLKSKWYPSIDVLRQPTQGAWVPVLQQITSELNAFRDKVIA